MTLTIVKANRREERVQVRVPRKLKFALDRYAEQREITVPAAVNEIMERFLKMPDQMMLTLENGETAFFGDQCWDALTPDRFLKIASYAPEYLTDSEQARWKIISEDPKYSDRNGRLNHKKIREDWNEINKRERELLEKEW